jgi:hypothetical protein
MSSQLGYKPDQDAVIDRLRRLYEERDQAIVLATMDVPTAAMQGFARRHPAGDAEYPDPEERAQFWDALFAERAAVRDDSIPGAYLSEMDQGLVGGLLGGKVSFLSDPNWGWISSMCEPVLEDWSQFDQLQPLDTNDTSNEWLRRYLHQIELFLQAAKGNWALSFFILIDSFNFAYEMRGATEAYLLAVDNPDLMHRIIDYAFDMNVKIQQLFFERAPLVAGGTVCNYCSWLPGGQVVSESVDPFHMASVDYFEEWGREPVERMFAAFDGGHVHIHANGSHLIPAIATLKGIKAITVCDERGHPPFLENLAKIKKETNGLPIALFDIDYPIFVQALEDHQLTGGVLYNVKNVPDIDTANRTMDKVREYRV